MAGSESVSKACVGCCTPVDSAAEATANAMLDAAGHYQRTAVEHPPALLLSCCCVLQLVCGHIATPGQHLEQSCKKHDNNNTSHGARTMYGKHRILAKSNGCQQKVHALNPGDSQPPCT